MYVYTIMAIDVLWECAYTKAVTLPEGKYRSFPLKTKSSVQQQDITLILCGVIPRNKVVAFVPVKCSLFLSWSHL